jgi:Zinc knuckle
MTFSDDRRCFQCGESGHIAALCPARSEKAPTEWTAGTRPPWCGQCDQRTRLVDCGSYASRCRHCWAWPERRTHRGQELPQHTSCGGCGDTIYAWDAAPCGKHQQLGIDRTGHRAAAEHKRTETVKHLASPGQATLQAEESRRERHAELNFAGSVV